MSDILLDVQSVAPTPAAGQAVIAVNTTTKRLQVVDADGFRRTMGFVNFSAIAQVVAASASRVYIAGSNIAIPAGALQIGTMFRWTLNMSKGSAGSTAMTYDIAFGTAGTTADTARVSMALPSTGSAVADQGSVTITAIHRGPVGASGVVVGHLEMTHNLASTGLAGIPAVSVNTVSSAFDVTTPTNIGLCFTTGDQEITFQIVTAEAYNV